MKNLERDRSSERGGAGVKVLAIFVVLILAAHAGYNYVPIAYEGANMRQEMDTAVVKGLATAGNMKPFDVVSAHVKQAATENRIPVDAVVEIKPVNGVMNAHVAYQKQINMLPFGLYKYNYVFDYTATPKGYLLKE